MIKVHVRALFATAALAGLSVVGGSADAQWFPAPIRQVLPTFSCSVNTSNGTVLITKTNSSSVNKTTDVTAAVSTPCGTVPAAVCGSQFTSDAVGTSVSASYSCTKLSRGFIFTCTASQTTQTLACNPPK